MPDLIVTDAIAQRAARASLAYDYGRDIWPDLGERTRQHETERARRGLLAALEPAITRGPLDGQEPLIGEIQ